MKVQNENNPQKMLDVNINLARWRCAIYRKSGKILIFILFS